MEGRPNLYSVILLKEGNREEMIKEVVDANLMSFKEAVEMMERKSILLKTDVNEDYAKKLAQALRKGGAKVDIRPTSNVKIKDPKEIEKIISNKQLSIEALKQQRDTSQEEKEEPSESKNLGDDVTINKSRKESRFQPNPYEEITSISYRIKTIVCPSCGFQQFESSKCIKCGIIFEEMEICQKCKTLYNKKQEKACPVCTQAEVERLKKQEEEKAKEKSKGPRVKCPSCGFEQAWSTTCINCGVSFSKARKESLNGTSQKGISSISGSFKPVVKKTPIKKPPIPKKESLEKPKSQSYILPVILFLIAIGIGTSYFVIYKIIEAKSTVPSHITEFMERQKNSQSELITLYNKPEQKEVTTNKLVTSNILPQKELPKTGELIKLTYLPKVSKTSLIPGLTYISPKKFYEISLPSDKWRIYKLPDIKGKNDIEIYSQDNKGYCSVFSDPELYFTSEQLKNNSLASLKKEVSNFKILSESQIENNGIKISGTGTLLTASGNYPIYLKLAYFSDNNGLCYSFKCLSEESNYLEFEEDFDKIIKSLKINKEEKVDKKSIKVAENVQPSLPPPIEKVDKKIIHHDIIVYTWPCERCQKVTSFLSSNNIPFIEKDIKDNLDNRKEMLKITGKRNPEHPVIIYGDTAIIGFNKGKLEELVESIKEAQ